MSQQEPFYIGTDQLIWVRSFGNLLPIASITSNGTTATCIAPSHGLSTSAIVNVSGAKHTPYNGDFAIAVIDTNTFTYTISIASPSPATGPTQLKVYDAGASISGVFKDSSGSTIVASIPFTYVAGSNGVYVGTLPHTASIVQGTGYVLTLTATSSTAAQWQYVLSGVGAAQP